MNDSYQEHIVKAKTRINDLVLFAAIWVVAVALFLFVPSMLVLLPIIILIAVNVMVVYKRLKLEYEYTMVNSELDIAAIYNKASRKAQLSLELKDAEVIAPKGSNHLGGLNNIKVKDFSAANSEDTTYGILIDGKQGKSVVYVTPDAAMLKQIKNWTGVRFNEF